MFFFKYCKKVETENTLKSSVDVAVTKLNQINEEISILPETLDAM